MTAFRQATDLLRVCDVPAGAMWGVLSAEQFDALAAPERVTRLGSADQAAGRQ